MFFPFPIFLPSNQNPEPQPKNSITGGALSHSGVSLMLRDEEQMLADMQEFGFGSELEIERQKGVIHGLRLAAGVTKFNTDW